MIRLATSQDAADLARIYRPAVENSVVSFEYVAPSATEMAQRLAETLAFGPWLVAESDGRVAGYAYAGPHRAREAYAWSVSVSVYVDAAAQRRGVGRRLYATLFALLKLQGFHSAYAGITQPNAASVALHTAFGFTPVGTYQRVGFKNGAWHDVACFQLALTDHPCPPAPVLAFATVQALPGWQAILAAG